MSVLVKWRVGLFFSAPASEPARVTSSPSRIQVMPSATMTRLWKRPQGSRSSRAGMSVSTMPPRSGCRIGSSDLPVENDGGKRRQRHENRVLAAVRLFLDGAHGAHVAEIAAAIDARIGV